MIVEERIYTLKIGALKPYRELYLAEGYDVQRSILGDPLGYYFTEVGVQNTVVHLWQYEDFEDRDARRAKLFEDANWLNYIQKVAPFVERQENRILKPFI